MGCIYIGSQTAFEAFVGSFTVLTTMSYLAAIIPFMIRRRASVPPGPFFMKGALGWTMNTLSCGYMMVWVIFYCFPYTANFSLESMNWSSLLVGGLTVLVALWYVCIQGPLQRTSCAVNEYVDCAEAF